MLNWLVNWYKSNCDGYWEHLYGIKIETIDNPGWSIEIDLLDTPYENTPFREIIINNSENDWIYCIVKDNKFNGSGDMNKLEKIIEVFKQWIENNT